MSSNALSLQFPERASACQLSKTWERRQIQQPKYTRGKRKEHAMNVSFIGLGIMGSRMARNLIERQATV